MAAGRRLALSAALAAFVSLLTGSVAERQAMELEGGRMAVVVQHHYMHGRPPRRVVDDAGRKVAVAGVSVEGAADGAAQGGSLNETLAQEIERLNKSLLDGTAKERRIAAQALRAVARQPGGERALLPAVPALAFALAQDADWHVRWLSVRALKQAGPEAVELAAPALMRAAAEDKRENVREKAILTLPLLGPERAVPVVLRAATEDEGGRVRAVAVGVLPRLGPKAAERAVPVLLRTATEDEDGRVRAAAIAALPQLGHEAAERAVSVVLRAAGDDEDGRVRAAAIAALPLLGPDAAERAVPVVLRVADGDPDEHVRAAAVALLPLLGPEAAERAVPVGLRAVTTDAVAGTGLREAAAAALLRLPGAAEAIERTVLNLSRENTEARFQFAALYSSDASTTADDFNHWSWLTSPTASVTTADDFRQLFWERFSDLERLADVLLSMEPAALERAVPTLVSALRLAVPFTGDRGRDHDYNAACRSLAEDFVVTVGRALAKMAPVAGPDALSDALYVLNQAEKASNVEGSIVLKIRLSRETVQGALQAQCASSFLKESSITTNVDNLTVEIPFGVMMVSDADGLHAHKCPNPYSCSGTRHMTMRPAEAHSSTRFKEGTCPLLLPTPLGGSHEATDEDSSMCTAGFDPASLGCAKCLPGFGRDNTDPFSCERCAKPGSAEKWAGWLAQPLVIFLLSLRSAENAAVAKGMADAMANDVVKIALAYLSGVSVVISSVTSTAAFREVGAVDLARETLGLTKQMAQRGDVTHSSSSDCLLTSGEGAASVGRLLALSVQLPACVLAVAALLLGARACRRAALSGLEELRADVLGTLVTCSLVAGNQFLPGVASACARALPCFHTQAAVDGKGPLQFMVYDPDTECYENARHLRICGIALVVAFVAGPVYWLTLLHRLQGAHQSGPLRFLTGSYRAGFHWWESGRLGKTMLIACVVTASPTSYCPQQQLLLCLLITGAFGFWHCYHLPYTYTVLNAAEAGALFTLFAGMVLSGLLAGDGWSLTPGFKSVLIMSVAVLLTLYVLVLAGLWLKVKFFLVEDADEEVFVEDSRGDGQRESNTA